MKEKILLSLIGICECISLVASLPSDTSFIVSSTEPSQKNGKDGCRNNSLQHPVIYEMHIKSTISNRFAKTLVVSKVRNDQTLAKETTFTMVLPKKAFISEFVMEIGGKAYKAYVKKKEEAKKDYERAIQSEQSAGHVIVSARDSNRFMVSINVEAEANVVFLLTYEELLERKSDQYELVLNIHPGEIVNILNVEVLINEYRRLRFVRTPSLRSGNKINNQGKLESSSDILFINKTTAVVKFSLDVKKQKQLAHQLGGEESMGLSGQYVVQYDVRRNRHGGELLLDNGYFIHFFAPFGLELLPKHVVFVLDTSKGMSGTKISQLRDAMNNILYEIRLDDIINIVEYNDKVKVWNLKFGNATIVNGLDGKFQEPFPVLSNLNLPAPATDTDEAIDNAIDIIDKMIASELPGVNIIGSLVTALYLVKLGQEYSTNKTKKYQPFVIFLNNAQPNVGIDSGDKIIDIVTKINTETTNASLFTLSFGNDANREFLKKLAFKNQGFSSHIYETSDASLQLQQFYKRISSPLLSNIHFKYESEIKDVTEVDFPIHFRGSELVVAGRYRTEDQLLQTSVHCWGLRGLKTLRPVAKKPVGSVERMWAYLTIKQTLNKIDSVQNKTELNKKALDLALKYSFVTDVTSLVVVEPNDTHVVDTEDATEGKSRNNNSMPKGQAPSKVTSRNSYSAYNGPSDSQASKPNEIEMALRKYLQEILMKSRVATTTTTTTIQPTSESMVKLSPRVPNLQDRLPWLSSGKNKGKILIFFSEKCTEIISILYEILFS